MAKPCPNTLTTGMPADDAGRATPTSQTEIAKELTMISPPNLAPLPEIGSYADPDAIHQPGAGYLLHAWIEHIEEIGAEGLAAEYQQIRREIPQGQFKAFHANKEKNRYQDVLCFDHSRVKLAGKVCGNDYIHGNYIDGYKHSRAYICTQGPFHATFIDFWHMIWQENAQIILMTTRLVERNREKCGQYWPTTPNKNYRYGPFLVSLKKVIKQTDCDLSYLQLRNIIMNKERWVCHVLYHAWPDYKVPKSPIAFLDFIKLVRSLHVTLTKHQLPDWTGHPLGPPIVIHCSAGIGRTGTFCAIDICLQRLMETGKVDAADVVRKIRSQRMHSIQTPEQVFSGRNVQYSKLTYSAGILVQYLFIHLVLLDYAVNSGLYNLKYLDLSGFMEESGRRQKSK